MTDSKIVGTGCPASASPPSVEAGTADKPCDVVITAGKGGKVRVREST